MNRRLLVLLLSAAAAAAPSDSGAAGDGAQWIAAFSWSPQYCRDNLASHEPQCATPEGFALSKLIRVKDGALLENCGDDPMPERLVLRLMSTTLLSREQIRQTWQRYGTCSGQTASEYAGLLEYIEGRVNWPASFNPDDRIPDYPLIDLADQISHANPTLDYRNMQFQCKGPWLEQVQICMDSGFHYTAQACPAVSSCGDQVKLRSFQKHAY
jgi:ribonuclease T2